MYEAVTDRCVTTTIIKPNKHPPSDEYRNGMDLSPPEKPPRRHSRAQRHQCVSQDLQEGRYSTYSVKCKIFFFNN